MSNIKKVAVIGSRTFSNFDLLEKTLLPLGTIVVVSGGANGADSLAEQYALKYNLEIIIFKADWKKFGKRAGYLRNIDIIAESDIVVAFWDGISKGTKHSLNLAESRNIPVTIVPF
jgi:hypothetical protein